MRLRCMGWVIHAANALRLAVQDANMIGLGQVLIDTSDTSDLSDTASPA